MTKTYNDAKNHFNDRVATLTLTGMLPIINGLNGKPLITALYSILVVMAVFEAKHEYDDIANCKEFNELQQLYNEIVAEITKNMSDLELTEINERYLYVRYLIENDYLYTKSKLPYGDLRYGRKKLARPLVFNGHELASSKAFLLEDLLRSSEIATASIKGKIVSSGVRLKETNNRPGILRVVDVKPRSLKDRFNVLFESYEYLAVAANSDGVYYLNPNEDEAYTVIDKKKNYLLSDKGNVFRISSGDKHYAAIEDLFKEAKSNDLLKDKERVINKIEEQKPLIDKMKKEIEDNFKKSEEIYKRLAL